MDNFKMNRQTLLMHQVMNLSSAFLKQQEQWKKEKSRYLHTGFKEVFLKELWI